MIKRTPIIENPATIFARVIQKIQKRTEKPEFPFGITQLDEMTNGLTRERVSIIAARPSEGKTSFGLQAAYKLADAGHPVVYVSLEDDREQLMEKLFCNICEIKNTELKKGFKPEYEPKREIAEKIFEKLTLLPIDNFGYNFEEVAQLVREVKPKPEVVFIDYIQMIDSEKDGSRWESISEFIRGFKKFSLEEKIATVILSQINRMGADEGRPSLHHLKQCGTLEEVADLALILHYPMRYGASSFDYDAKRGRGIEKAPKDYIEIQVEKNKSGPTGIVPAKFIGPHYRFEDWTDSTYA
ncbi:MAG TPA: DnaB-like helicase C-terminal domain-containing protein [Candidatus Omnitrophota bacterium]|nr:DnaB-like helicase C-terminal domain-containing protein [Candidatus Omnitrophota bacterium]